METDAPGEEPPKEPKRTQARRPGPHGAPAGAPEPTYWIPGPHGAPARTPEEAQAIARAVRRAERTTRRQFQEICPRTVIAAEAVTGLEAEEEESEQSRRGRLLHSRACFIATAAYGDPDAPEVEGLRRFRDRTLLRSTPGTVFVRLYYRFSPPLARLIARKPRVRVVVRKTLDLFRNRAAL